MTLQEAVRQLINLGENDPREIAELIRARHDDEWLTVELLAVASDLLADIARHELSAGRRSSLSLAKVATLNKREVMLQSAWLPGIGWVKLGEYTADDFDRLASQYRKGAAALNRYATWAELNAHAIREQGVEKFKQLKGRLPELPQAEEVA